MGDTPEGPSFSEWMRATIAAKGWNIADLSREIARQEGINVKDDDDFRRRSKAIHGYVSNMLNGEANWSDEYLKKIADALGVDQATMLVAAGRLRETSGGKHKPIKVDESTRGKLEALLGLLDEDERVEAIQYLTLFVQTKQQQKRQQSRAKPKRAHS